MKFTEQQLRSALRNFQVVDGKPNEFVASCLLHHPDTNPSMVITQAADKTVVHCRAGCDQDELWSRLREEVEGTKYEPREKFNAPLANLGKRTSQLPDSAAEDFLRQRGISMDVAKKLRLGFDPQWLFSKSKACRPALITPHYRKGELAGVKARALQEKDFDQQPGSTIDGLYALHALDKQSDSVCVFEGCEDVGLAMTNGYNATAVISSQSKVPDTDLATLCEYKNIYLVGDQDRAGKKIMDDLQQRLTVSLGHPEKVVRVRFPEFKDIGDMWKADPDRFKTRFNYFVRQAQICREHFDLDDLLQESEICEGQEDLTPYVVDKIVPMQSITMFFGEEKSGKSLLVTYILKCVANGEPVFGILPVSKRPVLYLDRENSNKEIVGMVDLFGSVGPEPIRYRTRATNCPEPNSPGLIAFCEKYKPLLVFDSLTKFCKDDKQNALDVFNPAAMSELFDKLLDLCAAGATVIIIHHSTKADVERYANSHQIGANVSRAFAVISEDRPKLEHVRLEAKLFRGAEPENFNLIAFPVIERVGMFGVANPGAVTTDADKVVDWIRNNKPQGCTRETVKKEMKGLRYNRKVSAIKDALAMRKLVDNQGVLDVPKHGNASKAEPTFPKAGTDGNEEFDFELKPSTVN